MIIPYGAAMVAERLQVLRIYFLVRGDAACFATGAQVFAGVKTITGHFSKTAVFVPLYLAPCACAASSIKNNRAYRRWLYPINIKGLAV